MRGWMIPWSLAVGLLAGIALACGAKDGQEITPVPTESVSGVVLNVVSDRPSARRTRGDIYSLDLQDDAGATWEFVRGAYRGVEPSHLREHQRQGLPITVSYRDENGRLVIVDIADFVPGETPVPHP